MKGVEKTRLSSYNEVITRVVILKSLSPRVCSKYKVVYPNILITLSSDSTPNSSGHTPLLSAISVTKGTDTVLNAKFVVYSSKIIY